MKTYCCCCASGILFTFLGIGLLFTGVSMVLNFRDFDSDVLPLGWQNSEGQRNLGIVMICLAVVFLAVGILVSVLFFAFKNKFFLERDDVEISKHERDVTPDPSPPIVTVVPPIEHFPDRQTSKSHTRHGEHKRRHSSKRGKSKNRRNPLATHQEIAEEPDGCNLRETPTDGGPFLRAPRSRADILANWDLNDDESDGQTESCGDVNDDVTDTEREYHMTHLKPILIASAEEPFSTCESAEALVPSETEPDVLEGPSRFRNFGDRQSHKHSEDIFRQTPPDDIFGSKGDVEVFRTRSFEDVLKQKSRSSDEMFGYTTSEETFRQRPFDDTLSSTPSVSLKSKSPDDRLINTSSDDTSRKRDTRRHKRTKSSEEVLQFDRELSVVLK